MLCRLSVMLGSVIMVLGSLRMMIVSFLVRHVSLLDGRSLTRPHVVAHCDRTRGFSRRERV